MSYLQPYKDTTTFMFNPGIIQPQTNVANPTSLPSNPINGVIRTFDDVVYPTVDPVLFSRGVWYSGNNTFFRIT